MSADERAEWEERYRAPNSVRIGAPAPFVVAAVTALYATGTALDLAGGTGRHALWLAERGWEAKLVDISPAALEIAATAASRKGLRLTTEIVDLDDADPSGGPWDLVVIHHYLNRDLLGRVHRLVRAGGTLIVCHQTRANLERNPRPSAEFLLAPGELVELLSRFELSTAFEGWTPQGRHEARVVGQPVRSPGGGRATAVSAAP
jgi:2-polyprenyl-3-methyl-5-hydroxy-6-metoxy-1,4-benzoquinol methylase